MNAITPRLLHFHPARQALDDRRWHCAITHWQEEHIARDNLAAQEGFLPWLPVEIVRVRPHRGPFVDKLQPLFPGYIFIGVKIGLDASPIASTRGIRDICRPAGADEPCPLHPRAMRALAELWQFLDEQGGWIDWRPHDEPERRPGGWRRVDRNRLAAELGLAPEGRAA